MQEQPSPQEQTIDTIVKDYFSAKNAEHKKDQLTDMIAAVAGVCRCFKDDAIQAELRRISDEPIRYCIEHKPLLFTVRQAQRLLKIKFTLGRLEWINYRDTHRFTKLNKEYYAEENTPQRTRMINSAEIIDIRHYLKVRITEIFADLVMAHSITLKPFVVPDISNAPIKAVGVEDFER